MHGRESTAHFVSSLAGALVDALAVFGGLWLASWLRFDSGWFSVDPIKGHPGLDGLLRQCLTATVLFVIVFRALGLYRRPHQGRFEDKIPRILRAIFLGFVLYFAAESALRLEPRISRKLLAISLITVTATVLLGRYILYRIEWNLARHMEIIHRVLILGCDPLALRLHRAIEKDPFLRSRVIGYLRAHPEDEWEPGIPAALRLGRIVQAEDFLRDGRANHLVLCDIGMDRDELLRLVILCEQHYAAFHLVPDLFRVLTRDVRVEHLAGIPVMGLGQWPLDRAGNRFVKRVFDITFSLGALLATGPLLLLAALAVKLGSPGPVFFIQERCGDRGRVFRMIKLRTMVADAEAQGPGWTTPGDPRRTRVGAFLRRWNLDELPQFINVLLGHMSVVGPRPERPVYVERFKDEIERYMRRHAHKPGITGWAQVHGLRGDTSIDERITYDLFYLENWSPGLDLKIILKTLASRTNAY